MRSSILAAALALVSSGAFAADLPSRATPPVYAPPPVPVFTWTGAYFGINAGYAFDNDARFRQLNGSVLPANSAIGNRHPALVTNSADGFTGGGQIGYNYQFGGLGGLGGAGVVIGFEADAAYTDITRQQTVIGTQSTPTIFRSNMDFLGTVRGRLGLAFNNVLIYGTGGLAYGDIFDSVNFVNGLNQGVPAGTTRFLGSRGGIETGYAYGGGVEYALSTSSFLNFFKSSAVTVKVEYLHYDLGAKTFNLTSVNPVQNVFYQSRVSTDGNIIRAGLNYKF